MVEENKANNVAEENKEMVATVWTGSNLWNEWTEEQKEARKQELLSLAAAYSPFTNRTDRYRADQAGSSGGFYCADDAQVSLLRSAVGEIIGMAGRKILNGDFNLTKISFPIKCMSPESMLVTMSDMASTMPMYMNRAAQSTEPVERMKHFMCAKLSYFFYAHQFSKPLNPILGETFQAYGQDGTKIYFEQTSHHPPRSHWLFEGPDNNWKSDGYLDMEIYAGIQTANLKANGVQRVTFKDGGNIRSNHNDDHFLGLFMGTMGHQMTGKMIFTDESNKLEGFIEFGAYNFRKQDFVWGEIKKDGKKISEIEGNYMGYLDFDEVRYWDAREKGTVHFELAGEELKNALPSQATLRTDGRAKISLPLAEAQTEKERLENLQRHDRKLRETVEARRSNGGPKHASMVAEAAVVE